MTLGSELSQNLKLKLSIEGTYDVLLLDLRLGVIVESHNGLKFCLFRELVAQGLFFESQGLTFICIILKFLEYKRLDS